MRGLAAQQHGTVALPGDLELYAPSRFAAGVAIAANADADELCILFRDTRVQASACGLGRLSRSRHTSHCRRLSGGRTRQLWRPT